MHDNNLNFASKWQQVNMLYTCRETMLCAAKGGASETVRARNIGLNEENGNFI